MTESITPLNAADCFRLGNECYQRGHYLNAQTLFDRAYRLEPDNPQYAAAQQQLAVLTFAFFKKGVPNTVSWDGAKEFCGQCCCEGCGECCAEGCCEICGEACGSCDCG